MRFPGKSAPAATASAGSSKEGNGSTFSFGVLAAMLACAAAFLGVGAPAASAAPEAGEAWNYKVTFGSEGGANQGDPIRNEIALDSNGNIFVQETNFGPVFVYKPSATEGGEFLTTATEGRLQVNIAIDQSTDALYVDGSAGFVEPLGIRRWVSDGQPVPTYTLDPTFEIPQGHGFAVDPTTQDILVTDPGAEAVRRYDDTGTLVETIDTPSFAPSWILMMADGSFYTASASGPDLKHFSGSGALIDTIAGVGQLRGLAYDPVRELIVASVGDQLKNYSLDGLLQGTSPSKGGGLGTVVDPSGLLYEENGSGTVNVYTQGVQPGVEDPVVSSITGHGAHIEAEVEPGEEGGLGEAPPGSKAHLEYSEDGGKNWKELPDQDLSAAGVAVVEADLTGLLANFEYQVRVVAENASENSATSSATTFTTAEIVPDVETAAATGLGETTATLNGTVNPNGLQTGYHFEYGTTTSYGSRVPVAVDAVAGDQRASRSFSNSISGLAPGTTYHYRIVAENSVGETTGSDNTFTTAGAGEAASPRAYELVTPVDKHGAQVANDLHFQPAPDGSAFAVNVSAGPDDGTSALMRQSYVTWRGSDGWSNWINADAPLAAGQGLFEASTLAISEDFTQALVVSNRDLAPGGYEGGGNLYLKELRTGAYTFVGGSPDPAAYQKLAGVNSNNAVFSAAAPDFSWILFWSRAPLAPEVESSALYRWTDDGTLEVESRLPGGDIPMLPRAVTIPTNAKLELPLASVDGSLVAFDLNEFGAGGVYIRENGESTVISLSHRATDDPAEVRPGTVDWVTPDGRYVFFHSSAQLTEDTPAPHGPENLYRYDAETENLTYLDDFLPGSSTLGLLGASEDGQTAYYDDSSKTMVWHEGDTDFVTTDQPGAVGGGNYVTDNGRYFGWLGSDGEVHLYDVEAGASVCVSCSPNGTSFGPAHFVPGQRGMANRSPRGILEDGTMFFDTPNPLLPADHNSTQDVYSYKDGYLTLISPGNANVGASFVDASEDGSDVFFQTEQGILPQDIDGSFDLYDARIGGGFPQPPAKAVCSGEGCRGPLMTAPQGATVGSSGSRQSAAPAISAVKPLTPPARAKLAKGKKVRLKVQVGRAGRIKVIGTASVGRVIKTSKQAKQAGPVSVPIRLSKKGLQKLNRTGTLAVRLTVSLDGEGQKAISFTLEAIRPQKGGSS